MFGSILETTDGIAALEPLLCHCAYRDSFIYLFSLGNKKFIYVSI
jgi:hypothetical protein